MKVKRILASVFATVIAFGCCLGLVGCKKLAYNAKKLTGVEYSKEFLEENRIGGVYYLDLETLDWNDQYVSDESLPKTIIRQIKNQEEFNKIFLKCSTAVDFEKEMVIVYLYPDRRNLEETTRITQVNMNENGVLNIEYEEYDPFDFKDIADFFNPRGSISELRWQRYMIAVKLDKMNVYSIVFTEK